jgi:hypothetical protein
MTDNGETDNGSQERLRDSKTVAADQTPGAPPSTLSTEQAGASARLPLRTQTLSWDTAVGAPRTYDGTFRR